MRKTLSAVAIAAVFATSGITAQAGGLAAPVTPVDVIIQDTATSSHDWVVPVMLLAALIAVVSNSSGGALAASDARVKTGITKVGTTAHGLPLYHFSYIGQTTVYEGVMAQDVARVMPEAVVTLDQGIMAVNYDMLGLEMRLVR